jgi:glycosyltransferase involved in cell wall biosynthesis
MKPVICHVLHSLNTGGAEVLACEFGRRHRDKYDVIYVCLDEAGNLAKVLESEGFKVFVLDRKPGFDYGLTKRFSKLFRDQRVALVHAHQYAPFFYSSMARGVLRKRPVILFTEHGRAFPDVRRPKRCLANRFLLKKCDRIVAVGEQVKQALVANEDLPAERIEVIYNGVDVSRYMATDTHKERFALRGELGIGENAQVVIQVARLNALKDHHTALAAMEQVIRKLPAVEFWIVGEGEERGSIEAEILRLGLATKVRLLGNRSDVNILMRAADVFLLTSVSEGIPLTVIEAMFSGLPCVCTDVGGLPEIIEHERNGLLAQARNPQGLADMLERVLTDSGFSGRLAVAGREDALARFSDEAMQIAYGRVYEQMLK